MLHWIITPKALADNILLTDENGKKHMHLICLNWSILIKNHTARAEFYNRYGNGYIKYGYINPPKPHSPLVELKIRADRAKEEDRRAGNDYRVSSNYLKFLEDYTFFDDIEFEECGTFDDNLFTNDCFVFSGNIPNIGDYNSYIGPMYIRKTHLSPEFKITKRMCYEAVYADHTKKHARPPLRKNNVPEVIVNILRERFGVTDDDWKWGKDGVYN